MKIWNNIKTILEYNLTFDKIRKVANGFPEATGKLYFYDSSGERAGGYIDFFTSTCYYKPNGEVPFTATRLTDSSVVVSFGRGMLLGTYDNISCVNDYYFWSDDMTSESGVIVKEHTEYRMRQKEQVKPTDDSQDWTDTGKFRDDPDFDVIVDGCMCGAEFRWKLVGTICDGINKCNRYRLQRKDNCISNWVDYQPIVDKIGEIIEIESSECGTHEYKEEWDDTPYCGSELNEKYNYQLIPTNKYRIKYAYIKKIDSEDWELVNCGFPLGYELIKENSFEC